MPFILLFKTLARKFKLVRIRNGGFTLLDEFSELLHNAMVLGACVFGENLLRESFRRLAGELADV